MKQDKNYLLVYKNNFVECDSLLEIYSESDEGIWHQLISELINIYCVMNVTNTLGPKLDKNDFRIFRRLNRSIKAAFKIDQSLRLKFDIEKMKKEHIDFVRSKTQDWQNDVQMTKSNKGPISVSRL